MQPEDQVRVWHLTDAAKQVTPSGRAELPDVPWSAAARTPDPDD